MKERQQEKIRIGLFGIGLDTYWPQFNGLLNRLSGYQKQIASRLRGYGVELVDAVMVDSPAKARAAASLFRREEVEFIFLYISTYALSSTVLPVVQGAGGKVFLLTAEGESVAGPVLQIGNTNSRYRFSLGATAFLNAWSKAGPAHLCSIGVGHIADKIEKLGALLGLEVRRVC
jgi:L-arabinose isomerase